MLKEKYDLETIDAKVLQVTLEDLDDKSYILVQKDDLHTLIEETEDEYGEYSDSSRDILEQIGGL